MTNLYQFERSALADESELKQAVEEALRAEPSPYDSHPSPVDRFKWVHAVAGAGGELSSVDQTEVWNLFENREEIEKTFTRAVCGSLGLPDFEPQTAA